MIYPNNNSLLYIRAIGGFPQKVMVNLRYTQEVQINAATGAIAEHVFRANSVYRPDVTGATTHQPMHYDTWTLHYDHYTVMSSRITARYVTTGNVNLVPAYYGVALTNDTSLPYTQVTDVFENPLTTTPRQGGLVYTNIIPDKSAKAVIGYSPKKFFGLTNVTDGAAYGATIVSNPAKPAYFNLYCASMHGNEPGALPFLVTIDYTVMFSEYVQGARN